MFLFIISVLLFYASYAMRCGDNQFQTVGAVTNAWQCCNLCQAGFYMTKPCTSHSITRCAACENGHFQNKWNNASSCKTCQQECQAGKTTRVNCSHTTDRQCRCPVHTYWDGGSLYCLQCRQCNLGEREIQSCTETHNRRCEACVGDTYAYKNLCLPCGRCRVGEVVIKECAHGTDIVCKLLPTRRGNNNNNTEPTPTTMLTVPNTTKLWTSGKVVLASTSSIAVRDNSNKNLFGVSPNVLIVCGVSLVIIFLVTVVLGIWCRRRRMKMDTNQPSDGYDTSTEDIDQNGMKRNVYVTQGSIQKKPETKVFADKGILWRDIAGSYVDEIGAILNPQSLADWSVLAGKLGYSQVQINNFRLDPTRATQVMLVDWGTSNAATVYHLYHTLKGMRRDDAAEKLLPLLMDPLLMDPLHSIV